MADKKNTIETKVAVDSKDAAKGMSEAGKASEGMGKSMKKASNNVEKLDEASGGLLTKFKAIVKNPIGLTITALVGLFKLFQGAVGRSSKASSTFSKIGAKLSGILNGLMAALEPVVEFIGEKLLAALNDPKQAIIDLGNSIKENLINRIKSFLKIGKAFGALMSGEFKKAAKLAADGVLQFATGIEDATDKVSKFGEEASKRFKEAAKATLDLAGAEKALVRNRIALEKQQLKSLKLAEDERQIRDDISKSIDKRLEANKRLGVILDEQAQKELALAQQALNLAYAKQKANGDIIESIEAVGDAELKILEIQERINGQRSEQLTNEQALIKEREDLILKAKEDAEAREAAELEAKKKKEEEEAEALRRKQEAENVAFELEIEKKRDRGERTLELELELLERKRKQDVAQADLTAQEIKNINDRAEYEKQKLRDISEKAEAAKEKAILDTAIGMAAEAFGISKEVAVAKMIMAAPEAIGNVWSQAAKQPTLPQMFLHGAVGTATTVAPIIKGLADIKKTRFSKGKGKGSGGASGGGSISPSSGTGSSSSSAGVSSELVTDISANNAARLGVDTDLSNGATATASANVSGSSSGDVVFSEDKYGSFQKQVEFKEDKTTV